jgi:hypothetical protein
MTEEIAPAPSPPSGGTSFSPVPELSPQLIRSEVVRELFEITEEELPMKTNTPGKVLIPMVNMETIEQACDPNRKKPLSRLWRENHDRRMISRGGKGRTEMLAALQTMMKEDVADELSI